MILALSCRDSVDSFYVDRNHNEMSDEEIISIVYMFCSHRDS